MCKGAACVFDDAGVVRDVSDRAPLFAEFLRDKIWGPKRDKPPIPEFLKNIEMIWDTPNLSHPFTAEELMWIRSRLPNGSTAKPHGVSYEELKTFLESEGGLTWMLTFMDRMLLEGAVPKAITKEMVMAGF